MTPALASSIPTPPPITVPSPAGQRLAAYSGNSMHRAYEAAVGSDLSSRGDLLPAIALIGFITVGAAGFNGIEALPRFNPTPVRGAHVHVSDSAVAPVPARSDVHMKLQAYRALQDGWLHDQALAPGDAAVDCAEALNALAEAGGWAPTRSYASGDGEVGLVWDRGEGYADVGFWSDGSLVYYARAADGTEVGDELTASDGLPPALLEVLGSFA